MKFFKKEEPKNDIYDEDGYDKDGYNKDGYDRFGFNRLGLNKHGFNRLGFDKDGYDKNGYDKNGYDREGLDLYGFNEEGYDHLGYDRFGYNKDGYDRYDFDKYGYDKNGYDREGYDKFGYNKEGLNKDGKTKEEVEKNNYDKDGYDIHGYNRYGYNRLGFNKYGYNKEGYDINGYNRLGFDKEGLNKNGTKYDEYGYNKEGYDKYGFNRYGFNKDGISKIALAKKKEFDKAISQYLGKYLYHEQYGRGTVVSIKPLDDYKRGYLKIEFDRTFTREFLFPDAIGNFISDTNIWDKNEEEMTYYDFEFKKEKKYLNKVLDILKTNIDKEYKAPILVRDNSWNNPYDCDYDPQETEDEFYTKSMRSFWNKVSLNPFFASIDSKKDGLVYIGKEQIDNLVYDWREKKASTYYMYNSLIANTDYDLSLVRNHTIEYKRYKGFVDIYNKNSKDTILNKNTTDEYLTRLLSESRVSKVTHDIITSIQNKQYEIIANMNNENIIVNGCAGSGKTMILYHKIAYNAFNQDGFIPKNMCVISSNLLLKREGDILAKDLKITDIRNYDIKSFYEALIEEASIKNNLLFILPELDNNKNYEQIYDDEFLLNQINGFNEFLAKDLSSLIINKLNRKVKSIFDTEINNLNDIKDLFTNSKYEDILQLFNKIPLVNVMESKILDKEFLAFLTNNFKDYFKDTIEYNSKGEVKKKGYLHEDLFKDFLTKINKKGKISIYNNSLRQCQTMIDLYDYIKLKNEIDIIESFLNGNKKAYLYNLLDMYLKDKDYYKNLSNLDYRFLMIYLTKDYYKNDYPFLPTIYIDEYQNYSKQEFRLLKEIYDYSSFSLFGDLKQRIEKKGINDVNSLPFSFKYYELNINYRNAHEICEYLNQRFDMNMISIGVKGKVLEQPKSIELFIEEEGDRTALIVKDFVNTKDLKAKNKVKFIDLKKKDRIEKDIINIILIDDCKGLEFEHVYVYEKGLTEEEKFLASSRALRSLTVIKE